MLNCYVISHLLNGNESEKISAQMEKKGTGGIIHVVLRKGAENSTTERLSNEEMLKMIKNRKLILSSEKRDS